MAFINVKSGEQEMPDAPIGAMALGSHTPANGYRPLIDPDGNLVLSPPSDVSENLSTRGYKAPTQDDLNFFARKEKYGEGAGNVAKAFGAGVLRGGSFGASDFILPKEATKGLQEFNPIASTAGEVAGAVGSAFLAPELAPTALVARGTEAVGAGVAKTLGEGALAKIAGKGVGSAIEGGVYGLGNSVSEAALGDPKEAAEHLVANIGLGAVLGGGLGALAKGGEVAGSAVLDKARESVGNAYSKLFGSVSELAGPLEEGLSREASYTPGLLTKNIIKANSLISGEPETEILERINAKLNSPALTLDKKEEIVRTLRDSMTETLEAGDKVGRLAYGLAKKTEAQNLLEGVDAGAARMELDKTVSSFKGAIEEMRREKSLFPERFPRQLELVLGDLEAKVKPEMSAGDVFNLLDETKGALDSKMNWKKISKASGFDTSIADAVGLLKSVRGQLKDRLENEEVWGTAATRQAALNSANYEFSQAKQDAIKLLGVRGEISPTKLNSMLNMINSARSDEQKAAISELFGKARNLVEEADKSFKNAPFEEFDKEGFLGLLQKREQQATRSQSIYQNAANAAGGGHGFVTDAISGAATGMFGNMLGGPLGGAGAVAAKGVFNAVKNPGGAVEKLIAFERAAQKTSNTIRSVAKAAMLTGAEVGKGKPGIGAFSAIYVGHEERAKAFEKRRDEIDEFRAQPEKAIEKLQEAVEHGYHAAPRLMGEVQQLTARGMAFLAGKLPQPNAGLLPLDAKNQISTADLNKFDRYFQAVHDPLEAIKELKTGFVSPESKETLQVVWPELYSATKREILDSLASITAKKNMPTMPQQRRLAISDFIGEPLDSSMMPKNILANQTVLNAQYAQKKAQEAAQMSRPTAKAMEKMGVADRIRTSMQTSTERA